MAQFDTSIYSTRPKSVDEFNAIADDAEARKLAGQSNRLALMLQQRQVQAADAAAREQADLQAAMRGLGPKASDEDVVSLLKGRGAFDAAGKFEAGSLDRGAKRANIAKDQAATEKEKLSMARDRIGMLNQAISGAKDQASYTQGLQMLAQNGIDVSTIPPKFDPAYVANAGQQALTVAQRIEQVWKAKNYDLDVRKADDVNAREAAQRAVTMRGQNMADARSRETAAATMSKPFEVTGPEGTPILVQQDKQGNIRPVEGFSPKTGASKPMTEGQAKANLFGSRMTESNDLIEKMAAQGVLRPSIIKKAAEGVPLIGGALGMAANVAVASPEQQQVDQAQRDFINAVLRRESGAVIADSEFKNADQQYFPQPGDSREVIAQKKRNRETAIAGIMAEVPAGVKKAAEAAKPASSGLSPAEQAELEQLRKQFPGRK